MPLTRPSSDFQNKTNVNPSIDRTQEATAQDFQEAGNLFNEYADAIEELQVDQSANPYYGRFASLAQLNLAYPTGEENAFAIIDAGAGVTPQIAAWDDVEELWEISGAISNIVTAATSSAFPSTGTADTLYIALNTMIPYIYYSSQYQPLVTSGNTQTFNVFSVKAVAESIPDASVIGQVLVEVDESNNVEIILFPADFSLYLNDVKALLDAGQATYLDIYNRTQKRFIKASVTSITYADEAETCYKVSVASGYTTSHFVLGDSIHVFFEFGSGSGNASTSTGTIADLSNPLGTYAHMDVASSEEELTFNDGNKVLGGIYFRFINCENKPVITGAIPIKKGETFVANTDMYLVARYNGNRVEYWFEDAESDLEQYIGLPFGAILTESPDPENDYYASPCVAKSSSDRYLFSHDIFGPGSNTKKTRIYYSDELSSNNWNLAETFTSLIWGTVFEYNDDLYILGCTDYPDGGVLRISKSTDDGETWSALTTVMSIPSGYSGFQTAPINPIFKDGYFVKAFTLSDSPYASFAASYNLVLVYADLSDLTNPSNWSTSNVIDFVGSTLVDSGIYSDTSYVKQPNGNTVYKGFLEPNVIEEIGTGEIIIVTRLEQNPNSNHALLYTVTWNSVDPTLSTIDSTPNYIDMPGGHVKFQILPDATSGKHWAVVNYNRFRYFGDGRIEGYLISSSDQCRTWSVHKKVVGYEVGASWESQIPQYACQYAHFIIDGNDLLVCDRTANVDANDWHNANLISLTRVENFRDVPAMSFVDGALIIDGNSEVIEDENGVAIIHDQTVYQNSMYMLTADNASKFPNFDNGIMPFNGSRYMRVIHSRYLNPDINNGISIFVVIDNLQATSGLRILSKASSASDGLGSTEWGFSPFGMTLQGHYTSGWTDLTIGENYIIAACYDNVNNEIWNFLNGANRGAPPSMVQGTWDTDHINVANAYNSGNFHELWVGRRIYSSNPLYFNSGIKAIHIIPSFVDSTAALAYISTLNSEYSIY